MEIKTKISEELINIFLSTDPYRNDMKHSYLVGDYVYATNGYICLKADKNLFDGEIQHDGSNKIGFEKPFNDAYARIEKDSVFSIQDIKEAFSVVKFYPVKGECDKCEGEGEVMCDHCGHDSECDKCGGSGEYGEVIRLEPSNEYKFNILGITFSDINIHKLIQAAELLGADEMILKTTPDAKDSALFEVGNIEVLVMPIYTNDAVIDFGDNLITIHPKNQADATI